MLRKQKHEKFPRDLAMARALELAPVLLRAPGVDAVGAFGSLTQQEELVGDIDLVVVTHTDTAQRCLAEAIRRNALCYPTDAFELPFWLRMSEQNMEAFVECAFAEPRIPLDVILWPANPDPVFIHRFRLQSGDATFLDSTAQDYHAYHSQARAFLPGDLPGYKWIFPRAWRSFVYSLVEKTFRFRRKAGRKWRHAIIWWRHARRWRQRTRPVRLPKPHRFVEGVRVVCLTPLQVVLELEHSQRVVAWQQLPLIRDALRTMEAAKEQVELIVADYWLAPGIPAHQHGEAFRELGLPVIVITPFAPNPTDWPRGLTVRFVADIRGWQTRLETTIAEVTTEDRGTIHLPG